MFRTSDAPGQSSRLSRGVRSCSRSKSCRHSTGRRCRRLQFEALETRRLLAADTATQEWNEPSGSQQPPAEESPPEPSTYSEHQAAADDPGTGEANDTSPEPATTGDSSETQQTSTHADAPHDSPPSSSTEPEGSHPDSQTAGPPSQEMNDQDSRAETENPVTENSGAENQETENQETENQETENPESQNPETDPHEASVEAGPGDDDSTSQQPEGGECAATTQWAPPPTGPEVCRDPLYDQYTRGQIQSAREDLDYPVVFEEKMPLYLELLRRGELTQRQAENLRDYLGQHELDRAIQAKIERDEALRAAQSEDFGVLLLHLAGDVGAAASLGVEATGVGLEAVTNEMMRTGIEAANHESLDMQVAGRLVLVAGIGGQASLCTAGEVAATTSNPVMGTGTLVIAGSVGLVHIARGDYESADTALGIAEAGIYRANPFNREPVVAVAIEEIENMDLQNLILGVYRTSDVIIPGVEAVLLPGLIRALDGNCFVAGTEVMMAGGDGVALQTADEATAGHATSDLDAAGNTDPRVDPLWHFSLLVGLGVAVRAVHRRRSHEASRRESWPRRVDDWMTRFQFSNLY